MLRILLDRSVVLSFSLWINVKFAGWCCVFIFADVAQPDQARIVILNAQSFLRDNGHVVISIKASCIDSTMPPETIFAGEVQKLKEAQFKPLEQVTLEPYERDHAMVSGW